MLPFYNNMKSKMKRAANEVTEPTIDEPVVEPKEPTVSEPPKSQPPSSNFMDALAVILHHEGGFVNHPKDPGGITNLGITKRVYDEWIGMTSSEQQMRDLTPEAVAPIYKAEYWDRMRCDALPRGIALCLFDFGVNAGTGRSARFLQTIVGTTADGAIGPVSVAAINSWIARKSEKELIERFQARRNDYYYSLHHFDTFGKGWLRRVKAVTDSALKLI